MGYPHDLSTVGEADRIRLGAKAVNLSRMMQAGLPVPAGFCVDDTVPADDPAILAAYRALGGGVVAVRSSAVGEDEPGAAAAGVFASRLGIRCAAELIAAIDDVRRSACTAHVRAYHPGGPAPGMAVIVQRLIEAEVAGVVFTRDPRDDSGESLAVAAGWGLGATVVGGGAADRFRVHRATRQLVEQVIAHKQTRQTAHGAEALPSESTDSPCLIPAQLRDLTALGLATEAVFGEPCDIEWAFAAGRFWLLQARPITAHSRLDLARLRDREIQDLRALADPHGTVWVRYHLAESAPRPTPMTWSVLQSLLSVSGGYGRMLRALGFDPDPRVDETGFVQLIAGQPYLNLNLEARLDYRDIPYTVDVERLKRTPALALLPRRDLAPGRTPFRFWWRLPATIWRLWRQARRLRRLRPVYADDLTGRVFPAFAEEVRHARRVDLTTESTEPLLARFENWRRRTLVEFAESALQPAVFASLAMQDLVAGAGDAERERRLEHLRVVLATAPRPVDSDQPAALHALLRGRLDLPSFLATFGHRGPEELELAQPRWCEVPPDFERIESPHDGPAAPSDPGVEAPAIRHYCAAVALRETSRHYFMLGYSYLRDLLLELDRRFDLAGGVFFLRPDELPDLLAGASVFERIRARRREYNLCRSLAVPTILFSDDLEAIGRPAERTGAAQWTGQPISLGQGEGPAVVASTPAAVPALVRPGFILVCPYVDAAWLPILVNAAAVVLETGSDLSHGAILLRELGIPAVAGVPGITVAVAAGDRLRVDGQRGDVTKLDCSEGGWP